MNTILSPLGILAIASAMAFAEEVDNVQADRPAYKDGWTTGDDGSAVP
jgi:hypothetical protein